MTVFDDYKDRLAGLDESNFIGQVVWYSINTGNVQLVDVEQYFAILNIPEKYLPKPIKPVDAFRKATNLQDSFRVEYPTPWMGEGHSARILIREVASETEKVTKHIVREHVDAKGKSLSYKQIGEAEFWRASRKARAQGRGGERVHFKVDPALVHVDELQRLNQMCTDINNRYHHYCAYLDGNAIRKVVRDFVTDLNSISVKPSGGVYFVHTGKRSKVDVIQKFVAMLNNGSTFHTLPLIDTQEQRDMLSEAFQTEVESAVEDLLSDISALNASTNNGEIPSKAYDALSERYFDLITRSEEYTKVLGSSQERAATAIEMAMNAVMAMAGRVKIEETP